MSLQPDDEMFLVSADDCFIAVEVKLGGGTIFTEAQPDCECEGGVHKQARVHKILTMILLDPEGNEQIITIPEDSPFGRALVEMDLYYYFKKLVDG